MRLIFGFALLVAVISSGVLAADPGQLSPVLLEKLEADFNANRQSTAIYNAVTNNDLNDLTLNRRIITEHDKLFNVELKGAGITNQAGSGRCWLFAELNVFNPKVMNKLQLGNFELSQPYLTFWDKMEKANNFLEEIIRLRERPLYDRELSLVLDGPFGDGGWWTYATGLIDKYGVVPIEAMPETKQSISTGDINKLCSRKLRVFASELRALHAAGTDSDQLRTRKEEMLGDIYALLAYAYGQPPREFTFRYESKKDSSIVGPLPYTPMSFYDEYLGGKMPEFVGLMDNPAKDYDILYEIESSRNMADADDLKLLNVPVDVLKKYCLASLRDSTAIWFACDVGKEHYRDSGILAVDIYDYQSILGMSFDISKADRITLRDSYPNHAMAIVGVDTTDSGEPSKWLVENSWGEKRGAKGYLHMYDDWFDEYVYLVVVEKRLLEPDDKAKFDQDPVVLPTWDPFYQALKKLR